MTTTKVVVIVCRGDGSPQTEADVIQALREVADRIEICGGLRKTMQRNVTDTNGKMVAWIKAE